MLIFSNFFGLFKNIWKNKKVVYKSYVILIHLKINLISIFMRTFFSDSVIFKFTKVVSKKTV